MKSNAELEVPTANHLGFYLIHTVKAGMVLYIQSLLVINRKGNQRVPCLKKKERSTYKLETPFDPKDHQVVD